MSDQKSTTSEFSRRELVRRGAVVAGAAAVPAALPAGFTRVTERVQASKGKLVIGAFDDPALIPFKAKILPAFTKATGIKVELNLQPYDAFFAKAFQDGSTKAGQFDIYIMDDPWIPQYAAAGILEDLGSHGVTASSDYAPPFIDLGYWPPRTGPRVKGFEKDKPKLIALPTIGDLQTLTYRNDIFKSGAPRTWSELVKVAGAAQKAGKIKDGIVFRGVKGNPIVTSWYPIFLSYGGKFFDDKWNVTFNSAEGKAAAEFFVGPLKKLAPKGVAAFDSTEEGAAILGGDAAAIIQYSGNAIKSDDPTQSKEVGKLDFGVVPKQVKALAQIGIFIHGVSASAPNMDNAITFMKWFGQNSVQTQLARAGDLPVKLPAFKDASAAKHHRLLPVALKQIKAGALARPRTPDWSKVEELLGTELNKALVAGSGGGAALDRAAKSATAYLKQQGYYK